MLNQLSVDKFLEQLSSESPAPGGGSVAALAGALSVALVAMVGRLTKTDEENRDKIANIITQADGLRINLSELITKDTEAFNAVMEAFKLPKQTEDEKRRRKEKIQQAMKHAAEVPMQVMQTSLAVLRLVSDIVELGNQNAITDVGVAGLLGYAAVEGAAYNVRVNLLSIKDDDFKQEKTKRVGEIIAQAEALSLEVSSVVETYLLL